MFKQLKHLVSATALACAAFGSQAAVLDFEDLPNLGGNPAFFLADYHGFKFGTNDKLTTAWFYSDELTSFYTPKSPTHWVSTDFNLAITGDPFEATQSITSAVDFVFDGAWFSGFGQIKYKLYNNGVEVYSSATPSASLADGFAIYVASGYSGPVDELVVLGQQGFFLMDDFTYNSQAVPEPTSLALVLAGAVAGAGFVRRRRQGSVAG